MKKDQKIGIYHLGDTPKALIDPYMLGHGHPRSHRTLGLEFMLLISEFGHYNTGFLANVSPGTREKTTIQHYWFHKNRRKLKAN